MLQVTCQGSPFEIGQQHGRAARTQVLGSITFYEELFQTTSKLSWAQVRTEAAKFLPMLLQQESSWTPLVEEMRGVADGAGVDFESILALNVRTEIAYGMFNDGCTAFSWKSAGAGSEGGGEEVDGGSSSSSSILAQNWDWQEEQHPNLICLRIIPSSSPSSSSPSSSSSNTSTSPRIHMITEAGIIGKIGLNSAGVGVTLNAIKAKGVDFSRLPCHLALRTVLDSPSREAATATLQRSGVASACHILIADGHTGGVGLECSAYDMVELPMTPDGIVTHTNHFIQPHAGPNPETPLLLPDSPFRLDRVRELLLLPPPLKQGCKPAQTRTPAPAMMASIAEEILQDEMNYPGSICRGPAEKSTMQTLFSVVMDLGRCSARVKVGRPTRVGAEVLVLAP